MKIMFLGTGAADYDWSRYGEPEVCGSTATLINDRLLIDCGPTVAAALERFGQQKSQITDIVVTHNHNDHFRLETLKEITAGREGGVRFFASPQLCQIAAPFCRVYPLDFGVRFRAGECDLLALPANHVVKDVAEKTFLYHIASEGRSLLYALDTAWLSSVAHRMLENIRFDGVIWDATMSEPGDWRIFDHTDPAMFAMIRKVFTDNGSIDAHTRIWFDHRARTLWPTAPAAQQEIARRENVELAHEGEIVFL